jgi:hypothetical protein
MLWVAVQAALNWAVKEEKIPTNPLRGKAGPKVEKEVGENVQAWTPEQVNAFLATPRPKHWAPRVKRPGGH